MRSFILVFLLASCGGTATVVSQPLTAAPESGEPDEPATAPVVDVAALTDSYVEAVCALHATPACAASRALTCADGLDLSDPSRCRALLASTATRCEGLADALAAAEPAVAACVAELRSMSCQDRAACGPDGPIEASGACAPVASVFRRACEAMPDPE